MACAEIFLVRGGRFSKKLEIFMTFFFDRPILFSELSENTIRTLFCETLSFVKAFLGTF